MEGREALAYGQASDKGLGSDPNLDPMRAGCAGVREEAR